jgi:hypothetical protein
MYLLKLVKQVVQACHVDNGSGLMARRAADGDKTYYLADRTLRGATVTSLSVIAPLISRTLYVLTAEGGKRKVVVGKGQVLVFSTKLFHSGGEGPENTGLNLLSREGERRYGDPAVFCYLDTEQNQHNTLSQMWMKAKMVQSFWLNPNESQLRGFLEVDLGQHSLGLRGGTKRKNLHAVIDEEDTAAVLVPDTVASSPRPQRSNKGVGARLPGFLYDDDVNRGGKRIKISNALM